MISDTFGAVIDATGTVWVWNDETRIAAKTAVHDVKAFARCGLWDKTVFYYKTDGTIGYFDYCTDIASITGLDFPVAFRVKQICRGENDDLYLLAENGVLYKRNEDGSFLSVQGLPKIADLQCVYQLWKDDYVFGSAYLARTRSGDYYGWGMNAFGVYADSQKEIITKPVKLKIDSSWKDVRICASVSGSMNCYFSCLDADGNVKIYDKSGKMISSLTGCSHTIAMDRSFLYQIADSIYWFGQYSNGSDLDESPLFNKSILTIPSSETASIFTGGWDTAVLLKDGSILSANPWESDIFYIRKENGDVLYLPM